MRSRRRSLAQALPAAALAGCLALAAAAWPAVAAAGTGAADARGVAAPGRSPERRQSAPVPDATAQSARAPGASAEAPPTAAEAAQVHAIAATLRCVVCQALSVADSPSTTAQQMRAIVLEQIRAGKTPDEVRAYFVSRYGEWVLLVPPRRGFNLLAWWLPYVALGAGAVAVVLAARRWVANGRKAARTPAAARADTLSDADRERLARELSGLRR